VSAFPTILDSTILAAAKSCNYKFWLEYCADWKPREPSVHLHAGASFARGLEVARKAFYSGVIETAVREEYLDANGQPAKRLAWKSEQSTPVDAASAEALGTGALLASYGTFECPEDSAKSASRMAGALEFYFDNYPLGADGALPVTLPSGKKGIEISFAEPLPIAHPESGDPLLYCGRLDMVAEFAGGVFGEDDKTTSSLGATWSRQWDLRSQFTGYSWGMKQSAGIKLQGMLVRGISILKTKYETQQAITYRPDWMVDEWFSYTCDLVEELVKNWKRGVWRKTLDHACTDYGGCAFRQPCLSPDPQPWLSQYFERRNWNPLTREEKLL
jgi:hypothetical protein